MLTLIIVLLAIVTAIHVRMMDMNKEHSTYSDNVEDANGASYNIYNQKAWNAFIDDIGIPLVEYCINFAYAVYMRFTLTNMSIFALKYVPTGLYMYKFIRDLYLTSRERIKQKQIEIEDIKQQIQIVDTKLRVRDAEFTTSMEQLQRSVELLRQVRARVRSVIANDDALRNSLYSAADHNLLLDASAQDEDREIFVELLKELKFDYLLKSDKSPELECGERAQTNPNTPENSVYSTLSDDDVQQDCRVKIIKVTNVYRIAYLKHYIKQKRLRRATKQALLKKKMENIKQLLEDWQNTLNMVINSKMTILKIDPHDSHDMDVASQEAMGDYSKPCESDSESDLRNSWSDVCYDEYNLNGAQNSYKPYAYNYEDSHDSVVSRECYDSQNNGDGQYSTPSLYYEGGVRRNITSIIEETNSQIIFEKSETEDDYECRDLIVL